jgi:hypothetical protein
MKHLPPMHPWLLALLPVISMYAANVGEGQGLELLVAAAVVLLVVTGLWACAWLFFRDDDKAALLVTAFVLLFQAYDTVFAAIARWHLGPVRFGRERYVWVACYLLLAGIATVLYRTHRSLRTVTGFATAVTAGMLLQPIATVAPTYLVSRMAARAPAGGSPLPHGAWMPDPPPDIYYLVFDRYGDASTIRNSYRYDNQAFYDHLKAKGFFIADDSRSNYLKTGLSLASSLNFTLLDTSVLGEPRDSSDWAAIYDLLAEHRLGRFLKAQGYSYIHVGSWWWPTRKNPNATWNINSYPFTPRPLMVLLNSGLMAPLLRKTASPWLDDRRQLWSRVNHDLAELGRVPAQAGPKFVFAHVLVPHPPYVFNRDGSFLSESQAAHTSDRDGYINQLAATTRKITALVDRILAESARPPIIVLQGDEGPYPTGTKKETFNWHGATRAQLLDKSGILNAYYLPGQKARVLYPSITPVNSFRVILNAYFGTALPLLPDRTYAHESDYRVYRFVDVTDTLRHPITNAGLSLETRTASEPLARADAAGGKTPGPNAEPFR